MQMHNRGNGKGGGIAAIGLSTEDLGVSQDVLDTHYMLQIALLQPDTLPKVEASNIEPYLDYSHQGVGLRLAGTTSRRAPMGRPLARMSLRLGERRTPCYLHLPAIALAQARRAGPTITSM